MDVSRRAASADRPAPDLWGFYDACALVGRALRYPDGFPCSAADLLAEMDHCGVAEALVVDALARENHPAEGNARVLETCRQSPRLRPAWAALPAAGDNEQLPPARFLEAMREHGVGAVFLYPNQYKFSLADWCVDPFLEPLAAARVPVFINPNAPDSGDRFGWDHTDLDAVVALCRRWPDLPVVISERRIRRSNRALYRAFDACPNLRLELSGYWLHRGIEYITRNWGAGRLLFGSSWPAMGHHSTVASVTMAEIDDGDRRRIAGDNLRELLSWSGPDAAVEVTFPAAADELVQWGRTGVRPPDLRLLDCHGHLGLACHYHLPDGDLGRLVAEMDRLGLERAVVFPFCGIFGGDEAHGNDVVAEAVRRFPDRFLGLTLVNPNRGREGMLRELARGQAMGLRGVKLINFYQGLPDEHPLVEVACQWAHERRQIILNHSWGSPAHLERLVSAYPDACYFVGHTTTAFAEVMARHPDIYVCTVPTLGPRDLDDVAARLGAGRVLYGTDLLDLPISWSLAPTLFARISLADKRRILGGNLA
ncbi:MAG: amidohydrolase family protein, partial [Gemmatimonadota bacterium]